MKRVFVTGTNRGIGLEFVRQYLARGDRLFATCRRLDMAADLQALAAAYPDRLTICHLILTDQRSIAASHDLVAGMVDGLDVLINNAGYYAKRERLGNLSAESIIDVFAVNSVAPLMIAQAYLDLLRAGERPRIVNITSQMGSLARKRSGGDYSYCASKAALNMLTRALAFDVQRLGITTVMMHPGWVKTDMGGAGAPLAPEEAVRGMIQVIDQLQPGDAGRFLQWDGRELPW